MIKPIASFGEIKRGGIERPPPRYIYGNRIPIILLAEYLKILQNFSTI